MSELKEWTASEIEEYDDARLELAEDSKIDCTRVYIKSEADKLIADLEESHKKEVEQLLMEIVKLKKEKECVIEHAAEVINGQERGLRHQKYLRLLDIAAWCLYKSKIFDQYARRTDYMPNIEKYRRKRDHYADRNNKLLLFAEQFKEAK